MFRAIAGACCGSGARAVNVVTLRLTPPSYMLLRKALKPTSLQKLHPQCMSVLVVLFVFVCVWVGGYLESMV